MCVGVVGCVCVGVSVCVCKSEREREINARIFLVLFHVTFWLDFS